MPAGFTKPPLEGRALEHALAGDPGFRIRMKNPQTGIFEWIGGVEAKAIRTQMAVRVALLKSEMKTQGLHIQSADCPVHLGQETRSVDVCLWSKQHCCNALVEAKWTRGTFHAATRRALRSVPMLKKACAEGIWQRSRKKVNAAAIGVLVVSASSWYCRLVCARTSVPMEFPCAERKVKKRRSGRSQSGSQKRKTNLHLKGLEISWRKRSGKTMTRRHEKHYRDSKPGKEVRARTNKKSYLKRVCQA